MNEAKLDDSLCAELRNLAAKELGEVPHVLESTPVPFSAVILKLRYSGRERTLRIAWVNRDAPKFQNIFDGLHVPPGAKVENVGACAVVVTWQEIDSVSETPALQPILWNDGFSALRR